MSTETYSRWLEEKGFHNMGYAPPGEHTYRRRYSVDGKEFLLNISFDETKTVASIRAFSGIEPTELFNKKPTDLDRRLTDLGASLIDHPEDPDNVWPRYDEIILTGKDPISVAETGDSILRKLIGYCEIIKKPEAVLTFYGGSADRRSLYYETTVNGEMAERGCIFLDNHKPVLSIKKAKEMVNIRAGNKYEVIGIVDNFN